MSLIRRRSSIRLRVASAMPIELSLKRFPVGAMTSAPDFTHRLASVMSDVKAISPTGSNRRARPSGCRGARPFDSRQRGLGLLLRERDARQRCRFGQRARSMPAPSCQPKPSKQRAKPVPARSMRLRSAAGAVPETAHLLQRLMNCEGRRLSFGAGFRRRVIRGKSGRGHGARISPPRRERKKSLPSRSTREIFPSSLNPIVTGASR